MSTKQVWCAGVERNVLIDIMQPKNPKSFFVWKVSETINRIKMAFGAILIKCGLKNNCLALSCFRMLFAIYNNPEDIYDTPCSEGLVTTRLFFQHCNFCLELRPDNQHVRNKHNQNHNNFITYRRDKCQQQNGPNKLEIHHCGMTTLSFLVKK